MLRTEMERLGRSRTIPKVDERPVWSVVCFVVRPGYRRRGVARALLEAAISYARGCGVVVHPHPGNAGSQRWTSKVAHAAGTDLARIDRESTDAGTGTVAGMVTSR